jgi:uncharacterized protein YutE (UPF0331/DUF86 family)
VSPGEVDAQVVRRHLLAIREALGVLANHAGAPLSALEANHEERWTVERGLQLCAQNVLDVATHIAAAEGRDVPDYASAIGELGSLGILPPDFASEFSSVAGFRNVLVHGYLEVDLPLLHRLLNEKLNDFETFTAHIENYIRQT